MEKIRFAQISEDDTKHSSSSENIQGTDTTKEGDFSQNDEEGILGKMILIDENFFMPIKQIVSVEKSQRVKQCEWDADNISVQFGMIINKDIRQDAYHPKVNVEFWYNTEELRDQRFNRMIEVLKETKFKFINI